MLFVVIFLVIIYLIVDYIYLFILKLIIKYQDAQAYKDLPEMEREINVSYSPAVVSYIYDGKVEPKKDIIATIINLKTKGIIDIIYKDNKYKVILKNTNGKFSLDEIYVYERILLGEGKFSYTEWVSEIKNEIAKLEIYNKSYTNWDFIKALFFQFISISIFLAIFLLTISLYGKENLSICQVLFFLLIFGIPFAANKFINNGVIKNLNNKEIKKWTKFKRFIVKYTLINKTKFESVEVLEKYISYSMALNINKDYNALWKDLVCERDRVRIISEYLLVESFITKPIVELANRERGDKYNTYYKK